MDKLQIYQIIKKENEAYGFDPILLLSIVEQESSFDETSLRMEDGFQERYLKHLQDLPTTSSVLLSTSYGLMQTLGEALLEDGYMEFFQDWYKDKYAQEIRGRSQIGIVKSIDEFMIHQDWQIRYGIKHFKKKWDTAHGDRHKALLGYNGGGKPSYPIEVLIKYDKWVATKFFA